MHAFFWQLELQEFAEYLQQNLVLASIILRNTYIEVMSVDRMQKYCILIRAHLRVPIFQAKNNNVQRSSQ